MSEHDAWDRLWDVLPARWRVGAPSFDPDPKQAHWSVTAIGPHPGRGKMPQTVTGTGVSLEAALQALAGRLTGAADPAAGTRLDELRRRLRLTYVQAAESEWPGMTSEDLAGVIARVPGGLTDR